MNLTTEITKNTKGVETLGYCQASLRDEGEILVALGWKPAVWHGFQPAGLANFRAHRNVRTASRLEIGDTAGWKPALLRLDLGF